MAGLGAAVNTGAVSRDDTVAVIGCGGVGDAAIAGAWLLGEQLSTRGYIGCALMLAGMLAAQLWPKKPQLVTA